eukprot:6040751-Pyramimonas_sp.AAC.1
MRSVRARSLRAHRCVDTRRRRSSRRRRRRRRLGRMDTNSAPRWPCGSRAICPREVSADISMR